MNILTIHDGHNASAAFLQDSKVVAAIQEERLSREKNHGGFPEQAIREVLKIAGCSLEDVDCAVFCGIGMTNRKMRVEVMEGYNQRFVPGKRGFLKALEKKTRELCNALSPLAQKKRKDRRRTKKQEGRMQPLLKMNFPKEKVRFVEHHLCHAAATYFGEGNLSDRILVLTCDGAGDSLSATVSVGQHGRLERLAEVSKADSVPVLYSFITYLLGFVPLEHEYKLMGLAPYAEGAKRSREISDYFHSLFSFSKTNPLVWDRSDYIPSTFDLAPVLLEKMKFQRFDNIASGLQTFIEEFFLEWVQKAIAATGIHKLALSGGLFMNVKLNKRIMELPEVESLFVFPSCADETNSIGAGWATYADACHKEGREADIPPLKDIYWGGDFTSEEAEKAIGDYRFQKQIRVTRCEDIELRCAELITKGEVVARCKGRMEFGARALGNRTILADAGNWKTVHVINAMIKQRDFWMPFAPSILSEYSDDYLVNPKSLKAPYMILSFDTRKEKLDTIVAAIHPYDGTCRPQVVEKSWNPDYHRLIRYYRDLTGTAAVLNTSFNLHGFPIVYTPRDALEVFDRSGLRYLALGEYLIEEVDKTV